MRYKHDSSSGVWQRSLVVLLLTITTAVLYISVSVLRFNPAYETPEQPQPRSVLVTPRNIEDIADDSEDNVTPSSYQAVMNTRWIFEAPDKASVNAFAENNRVNTTPVILRVFIVGEDTPIFTSGVMMPGDDLSDVILSESLSPGTYDCIARYYLLDENGAETGEVNMGLTILIQGD
ncbi:MAG: hypothetical protein IKQ56_08505 [Lachnospiraceae bacterium]|nr:hypothetical protein [Lachnospiraceae bacterium]